MKHNKLKATIDDGFQPELVQKARFEGIFEIPVIDKPKRIFIPDGITPFSRRNEVPTENEAIGFFEMDPMFADVNQPLLANSRHRRFCTCSLGQPRHLHDRRVA